MAAATRLERFAIERVLHGNRLVAGHGWHSYDAKMKPSFLAALVLVILPFPDQGRSNSAKAPMTDSMRLAM